MTKRDYDTVVRVVDLWWSGPIAQLAHPVFFYELGRLARIVEDVARDGKLVGFLLGFMVATESTPELRTAELEEPEAIEARRQATGYVHMVGIDPAYRRRGVARTLYRDFEANCRAAGCRALKAVTTVGNDVSLRFHDALGFSAIEDPNYAGAGRRRMVLTRQL